MTSKVSEARPAPPRLKTSRFELVSASHGSCDNPRDIRDQANFARRRRWCPLPFDFQDCHAFLKGYANTVGVTQGTPKLQFGYKASSKTDYNRQLLARIYSASPTPHDPFTRNRMGLKARTDSNPATPFTNVHTRNGILWSFRSPWFSLPL